MATLLNADGTDAANLTAQSGQFFERDIVWLISTGTYGADKEARATAAAAAVQVLGQYWSISIIGVPTTAGCIFGCHGPATLTADEITDLNAEMVLAGLASNVVSVVTLTGIALA